MNSLKINDILNNFYSDGPFRAYISGPPFINKTQLGRELQLSCSTDEIFPSATYSWTVSGTYRTTFRCSSGPTCVLTPRLQDDGTIVTCTATNERDDNIYALQTYKINVACKFSHYRLINIIIWNTSELIVPKIYCSQK